ncbi:MAG: AMP-binding protein [Ilumatobacter sp.]|nr:AMP-binding protein [Ilumatobacter sp.]
MTAATTHTFVELWSSAVAHRGGAPFLTFEGPSGAVTDWTYDEFDRVVARAAAALAERGVAPGSSVHLALTNSPTFVAFWIATLRLGGWIVPSDPMGRTPEFAEHIERTSPAVGVCATERAATYLPAAGDRPVIRIDEADTSFDWLPADGVDEWPEVAATDRAAVMFTSGTTGRPKGVEITQANYAFAGTTMASAAGLGADDRQIVVLPLFHANAQYYSFASAIAVGASVALIHTFSASGFIPQAARHRATHASLFAGPIRMILARGGPLDPTSGDQLRLRHCWFAQNLGDDQFDTFSAWIGCRPRQLYGMTETIPAVLTDTTDDPRPDSMGTVSDGCVLEVHDEHGDRCQPGTVGEIVVGGRPGYELFAGYLDDPVTTAASFRGAWFRTGDRAWVDEAGRHHFDGRRADVLKVSGENVSVVEVEAVVGAHAEVHEVVVVGAPDPIRDEVPVAFVVPTETADRAGLPARLDAWSTERLGKAKQPRHYEIVDDLPRTSVGKIRKFLLADAAAAVASPASHTDPPNQQPESQS